MSDRFQPIAMEQLTAWIAGELQGKGSIFGIPSELFFRPREKDRITRTLYGSLLETPFGVAAGPHTQMAQNIIASWLCGARFIELKTIQTLDELDVSKPCIDMQDEGYNVEWSQELKVEQSFEEYLRAWVLIHVLHRHLGFPRAAPGVIFNMSVGYNMEGILKPNVQGFLAKMRDAGEDLKRHIEIVAKHFPEARDIAIPTCISNNVTLSTMHGCPPEEIGKIARYLIEEWGLHTNVKLNPTLLGERVVRSILNERLGFHDIEVPDIAFEHDLKYPDAVSLIRELGAAAKKKGVVFGVKLSNTLETVNKRASFSTREKMAYLSGRPLHAVTVNLAARLQDEFDGKLLVSFAGGADAFNVARLLACGMNTITTCSDLLRPGSYMRLLQYIDNTIMALDVADADDLDAYACNVARAFDQTACDRGGPNCALLNLLKYARDVLDEPLLRKKRFDRSNTKTTRPLGLFDCIKAPCSDICPIEQRVPVYMRYVWEGRLAEAADVIRADNPLGAILGRACNHPCQTVCTRVHYDDPIAIREVKRYVMEHEETRVAEASETRKDCRVAIIGSGPCGLGAAYFLASAGYPVTVFEAHAYAGGMVSGSIPGYRASSRVIAQDLQRLEKLGVEFRYNRKAGRDFTLETLRDGGYRYTVVAAGAQNGQKLGIAGEDAEGVFDSLEFLRAVREKKPLKLGRRVGVIGGGDVAMDCARTAWRLGAEEVSVIYRRTKAEMPAQYEERYGLEVEGIPVRELLAPKAIEVKNGRIAALQCAVMQLGEPDASGRRRPVEVPGSSERIPLDALVVAISQSADLKFFGEAPPALTKKGFIEADKATLRTSIPDVYAGGDIVQDGPATIVKAVGDGKRIAQDIRRREEGVEPPPRPSSDGDLHALLKKRARRKFQVDVAQANPLIRRNFKEVVETLPPTTAKAEAGRCLDCNVLCSQCVAVCPNLAFVTYRAQPFAAQLQTIVKRGEAFETTPGSSFRVAQNFQVLVLTDFCNECGNCVAFCPTAGKPYQDKPRLYLSAKEFEAQSDNAFRVLHHDDGRWAMQGRWKGVAHEIIWNHSIIYRVPGLTAELEPETLKVRVAMIGSKVPDGAMFPLEPCATMCALLRGIRADLPHIPTSEAVDAS